MLSKDFACLMATTKTWLEDVKMRRCEESVKGKLKNRPLLLQVLGYSVNILALEQVRTYLGNMYIHTFT